MILVVKSQGEKTVTIYNLLLLAGGMSSLFAVGFYPTFIKTKRLQIEIMFLGTTVFWLGLYVFYSDVRYLFPPVALPFIIGTYLIMLISLAVKFIRTYRTPKASS
jgi:urea transporter